MIQVQAKCQQQDTRSAARLLQCFDGNLNHQRSRSVVSPPVPENARGMPGSGNWWCLTILTLQSQLAIRAVFGYRFLMCSSLSFCLLVVRL